jgi:hypothetical protein
MCAGRGLAARINGAGGNVRCQNPGEWAAVCEQIAHENVRYRHSEFARQPEAS